MANLYYDVRVDISNSEVLESGLRFTQGDSDVIFLRIAVMNGASKFDATNTTPSVNFAKPDGTYVTGAPVASDDVWVYQFLGNELQAPGRVVGDIKFTYSSGRVSSGKFTFFVEKDTTITGAEASSSYVLPMEQALGEMLNYKQQGQSMAEAAEASALDSEAWAVGQRGGSDVESDDPTYENNSKYYAEQAEISAESAAAIVGIGIATTTTAGIVKPDGTTITVAADGTISSSGGSFEQVQSDWAQTSTSAVDYIKNKPNIPAAQIQSDWTQTSTSSVDYIKNKPTIPTVNNAALTIQQNGTTIATFSATASSAATANIVTDGWTSAATAQTVGDDVVVIFDNLNNSYGYSLYASGDDISYTSVTESTGTTSGTKKLTYVLDGATSGVSSLKLRILK